MIDAFGNKRIIKGRGGLGSWWLRGDHPNYSIIDNGQNTEKSPGDLRSLAVTQTPVKDHQLTLMLKALKERIRLIIITTTTTTTTIIIIIII